ncbi:MAG: fatty acyl-AMP ligase, partial [Myxococcota bacterium]
MRTLVQVLRENASRADRADVFVRMNGEERTVPYPELYALACQRAHRLHELGLEKGDRVAIILPEPDSFVLAFLGAITAGLVPVPMYPPLTLAKMDAYGETVRHILSASGAQALITVPGLAPMLQQHLISEVGDDVKLILDQDLEGEPMVDPVPPCEVTLDDVAFLQFTSGSTRKPKGVVVTHRNLAANAKCVMFDGLKATENDKGVTWLPLYHDMGLIGFVIAPLFAQVPVVFLPTMNFIRRPQLWLEAIHKHRGTITFAPNFAYALATRAIKREQSAEWDLSCLKAVGCGAEPILPSTIEAFVDRFSESGLRRSAILPCYGLAEATLAVAFRGLELPMLTERVCANAMNDGVAKPASDKGALEIVSVGKAFPDHELRVVDETGATLADGVVGHVLLKGPSVTPGYFKAPQETAAVFQADGWLRTGDLGYLRDGELFVCGRAKDLIIINGKNYYPQDIERIAADAYGVRPDQCVAFARPGVSSEECVVVAEALKRGTDVDGIDAAIKQKVRTELGVPV